MEQKSQLHMKIKTKTKLRKKKQANENKQSKNFTCKVLKKVETKFCFLSPHNKHKFDTFTTPICEYEQIKLAH